MTTGAWLAKGQAYLVSRGVSEAEANAEFMMGHVLRATRPELRLQLGRVLTEKQGRHFWNLVLERGRRLPLAYVLGTQPFLGLEIKVNASVLVPRPETEELVSEAARLLKARENEPLQILEIGTGTGCISIALAALLPKAMIHATDISPAALKLAFENAQTHHQERKIRFVQEDLYEPGLQSKGWADLVISNPPYIPSAEIDRLEPEVLQEPRLALDGGRDGLAAIRAIAAEAPRHLRPGGWFVLEIGHDQRGAVLALLSGAGFREGMVKTDAQGHDRIALARWPGA